MHGFLSFHLRTPMATSNKQLRGASGANLVLVSIVVKEPENRAPNPACPLYCLPKRLAASVMDFLTFWRPGHRTSHAKLCLGSKSLARQGRERLRKRSMCPCHGHSQNVVRVRRTCAGCLPKSLNHGKAVRIIAGHKGQLEK